MKQDVIVGEHYLDKKSDGIRYKVCGHSDHPRWYPQHDLSYDFSILHLRKSVKFNNRVAPACLPDSRMEGTFLAYKKMTVSGWGTLSYGGKSSNVLMSVDVTGDTNKHCSDAYKSKPQFHITNAMLCAGEHSYEADSCQGDSGGKQRMFITNILYNPRQIEFYK